MSHAQECAIVGGGLAGLVGYATLRHRGLTPAEIDVFGTDADPAGQWRVRAAAIRQRRMRSESDGHCAPRSFPGLAVRAALRDKSPLPLVESWLDRYRPTVEEFLEHVEEVRAESGWDESFRRSRVKRIRAADGGFDLDGFGRYRHVLASRFLRSLKETHVRSTPTSRMSTPSAWRSSARAWPPRPSG
jgi:cation diffusion facilitator CzcD-associated flavoprotein CzcO